MRGREGKGEGRQLGRVAKGDGRNSNLALHCNKTLNPYEPVSICLLFNVLYKQDIFPNTIVIIFPIPLM